MRFTGGLPETVCGAGSTLDATAAISAALPGLLSALGVRTLLDAPCGDRNWMRHVNLSGIVYIGADIQDESLTRAGDDGADIRRLDIIRDPLPTADAMLCRDFHQHLPNAQVFAALRNFAASGIPWLIATTHYEAHNGDIAEVGDFRPLNLMAAPFNLSPPIAALEDCGRSLGAWPRTAIVRAIG